MVSTVLAAPILRNRITDLAEKRLAVEENEGLLDKKDPLYMSKRSQRKSTIEKSLEELSERIVSDMICKFESKPFIRGAYYLTTQLLTRAYHQGRTAILEYFACYSNTFHSGIHVSSEEVLRLRKVAEKAEKDKQSIIFLPCHKSHVDYVSMQLICYRLGLALPTVVAGDNLNFPVVGAFLQNAGMDLNFLFMEYTNRLKAPCTFGEVLGTTPFTPHLFNRTSTPCCKADITLNVSLKEDDREQGSFFLPNLAY